MNDKLDKKLCKKYPKIFKDRRASMENTAMCWGFEHGDGWYNILDRLCCCIQSYIDANINHSTDIIQLVATQVKEKYGTLRFYYNGGSDEIAGMVQFAENLSRYICESCGRYQENTTIKDVGHWVYNMCDTCWCKSSRNSDASEDDKREDFEKWKKNIAKGAKKLAKMLSKTKGGLK